MLRRVFLLIKRIDFMIQIHASFSLLTGTSIPILVSKRWSPTFFDLADSLNVNLKTHARTNFALFDQFTWQKELCTIEYLLHYWKKSTLVQILFWMSNNFCTQHVLPRFELGIFMYWTCNSMKNLSSYCGLVDAKIRASDKDLPVS